MLLLYYCYVKYLLQKGCFTTRNCTRYVQFRCSGAAIPISKGVAAILEDVTETSIFIFQAYLCQNNFSKKRFRSAARCIQNKHINQKWSGTVAYILLLEIILCSFDRAGIIEIFLIYGWNTIMEKI